MMRRLLLLLILLCLPLAGALADTDTNAETKAKAEAKTEADAELVEKDRAAKQDDDTSEIDTETTVDSAEADTDFKFDVDFRAIYDHRDATFGDGTSFRDDLAGFRVRSRVDYGITEPRSISVPASPAPALQVMDATSISSWKIRRLRAMA